jgi:hypothetical protein
MAQSFIEALKTQEKKPAYTIPEDHINITWDKERGVVYEEGRKSADTLEREKKMTEKELDINARMNLAIEIIERRRQAYRKQDLENYGYDKYTQEFHYEVESDSEEEPDE